MVITSQLSAVACKLTVATRVLDLNETVEGMLKMPRPLIGEDLELAWRLEINGRDLANQLQALCPDLKFSLDAIPGPAHPSLAS
ncbi:hypothetical protein [Desulfoferrobacter suflitae]|uniref:hypothetical protein n=1 Tax=Desulfoferrobacter suflitae TaxID=2865782 RepID=UPI002164A240|nr:hypothetical protein [Desulfoferrobacter suflitae]MCK8604301.1 hypothetical protein [Desulfoferrobacter suflitae]